MRTRGGMDYLGKMSTDAEGRDCYPWSLSMPSERFSKTVNFDVERSRNYCRNIGGTYLGKPNCLVSSSRGTFIYSECAIDYCECSNTQYRCKSGLCIPLSLICNGLADCDDGSDEDVPCVSSNTVSCTFNENYVCGYNQPVDIYLQWTRIKGRGLNSVSPRAGRDGTSIGYYLLIDSSVPPTNKQTVIFTPIHDYTRPTSLQFYLYMGDKDKNAMLQVIQIMKYAHCW
ncbi:hypothetical protein LSH36_1020g00003 [Paralvinella palmiformis]|uniref:Uncharacterized protein n=1 Tax=Paralvinella palmiformis TaxID=53620 RepID=A0AAD9IVW0_9ANNE|nr:hypothetical protein LSH36_1020g00003 [Paralvinella palmiformis]